jgi:hypothetical protein
MNEKRMIQGRIQDFKLGAGGRTIKKIAPSRGRCENCWGISCEKSRCYAKNSYFFQFKGGERRMRPSPWIRPWDLIVIRTNGAYLAYIP